jgi:hypothetical protein
MARWSKKLLREQMSWTSRCFRRALLDVYGETLTDEEKNLDLLDLKVIIVRKGNEIWTQQTNEIYLGYLRELKTDQIELIIDAYTKGKQYRSPLTIDVLMSELLERSANPETRKTHGKTTK